MASNGLLFEAKSEKCRICQRVRKTEYLKAVGEVRHGFAVGHIWECLDTAECQDSAYRKLNDNNVTIVIKRTIKAALNIGRFTDYKVFN